MSETEDVEEAERLANEILHQNDTCSLAYYAKAMAANYTNNYPQMIKYQKEAISRDYFNHEVYVNYLYMLYDGICYAMETDHQEIYTMCRKEIIDVPSYMRSAERQMGKLGRKINDQPDLTVDEEMKRIIEAVCGIDEMSNNKFLLVAV